MEKLESIKEKFFNIYNYKIKSINERKDNPLMNNMNHYKITLIHRNSLNKANFNYSEGLGIKRDLTKEIDIKEMVFSCVMSIIQDEPYKDLDEFEGLGYSGKDAVRIYKLICNSLNKARKIYLLDWFRDLSEEEKEVLQNDY